MEHCDDCRVCGAPHSCGYCDMQEHELELCTKENEELNDKLNRTLNACSELKNGWTRLATLLTEFIQRDNPNGRFDDELASAAQDELRYQGYE